MSDLLSFLATLAGGGAAGALLMVSWYTDTKRENKQLRSEVKAYKRKIHALAYRLGQADAELARRNQDD